MRLETIEPWLIAALFGTLALLCGHVASLCGHIADLVRLIFVLRSDVAWGHQRRRWRQQRGFYWALCASCASGAVCFVAIAPGWAWSSNPLAPLLAHHLC